MDYTAWALGQVKALVPGATTRVWPSVQDLIAALNTLRTSGAQIFGLAASNLTEEGRSPVDAAVVEALVAWKAHFDSEKDIAALLDLDKVGRAFNVPALVVTKRFPLRCDPLGTRDGLSAEWLRRLEKLDEAIAGKRTLDAAAVNVVRADEGSTLEVAFGAPDEAALYDYVIRHETPRPREAFPRELAAFWSTANGIVIDDAPFLASIRDWSDEDNGLRIGCGGYEQGSLTIAVTKKAGLLTAKLTDRDDDGVVRAKYKNIGELFDALLGD